MKTTASFGREGGCFYFAFHIAFSFLLGKIKARLTVIDKSGRVVYIDIEKGATIDGQLPLWFKK